VKLRRPWLAVPLFADRGNTLAVPVFQKPFFGGANLTTADIMMVYCVTTSRAFRGTSIDPYPNLKAYLKRIGERPAYQRAMAKAEPGVTPMLA
jgi:glutathione S-transferase